MDLVALSDDDSMFMQVVYLVSRSENLDYQ
jgi:hypothetical protein